MARRLQRGHRDREILLANAIEASDQERRRIASDLHDGVVQDVAGRRVRPRPAGRDGGAARRRARGAACSRARRRPCARASATCARCSSRSTRRASSPTGLEAALSDLLSPLRDDGHRDRAARRRRGGARLEQRSARLPGRARGAAQRAEVRRGRHGAHRRDAARAGATRLVVTDDGKGFSPEERDAPRRGGPRRPDACSTASSASRTAHCAIRSAPGQGTTVELEVPAR